jgi:hypothetical protein
VQGLVDVAGPMAQELERRQLLLVGCIQRCQNREVMLDRADHALLGHGALIVIKPGRVAGQIDEMLGRTLPRPVGPVARRAERGELRVLPDERYHALAGSVVQLEERQLADGLMAEAAPGQGWWGTQQQCRRERCKLGHENTPFCALQVTHIWHQEFDVRPRPIPRAPSHRIGSVHGGVRK